MKLCITIINYNSKTYLSECVRSIYDNLKDYRDYAILVIDNNSCDESISLLEGSFPEVRVIKNDKNLGFVKGVNQGIANADSEYILILNPDTLLLDKNILSMIDFMSANSAIGICGPLIVLPDGSFQSRPCKFNSIFSELKFITGVNFFNKFFIKTKITDTTECDYISGSCMLIRKSIFKETGLFDENIYMFAEEEDICYRAKRKGWKTYLYPFCKVLHYGQRSFEGLEENRIINQRMSALYYYSKRYNRFFMILMRAVFLINTFMRICSVGLHCIFKCTEIRKNLIMLKANFKVAIFILAMKDSRNLNMVGP